MLHENYSLNIGDVWISDCENFDWKSFWNFLRFVDLRMAVILRENMNQGMRKNELEGKKDTDR